MNTKLRLTVLDGEYAIHRLLPEQDIPSSVLKNDFFAITRTGEELCNRITLFGLKNCPNRLQMLCFSVNLKSKV